jgi:DNA-binding Lrp family transcriptional regulator
MEMNIEPPPVALDAEDQALLRAIEDGLPLVARPYAELGARLDMSEGEVLARIWLLRESGVIKRFGVVVRHRELGYRANAMVVWDVPDERVGAVGLELGRVAFVTLCYRRPRRPPDWPYNLFTMIHGRDRDQVLARVAQMTQQFGLDGIQHQVLFSGRRFKQCGARYGVGSPPQPRLRQRARMP